LTPAQRKTIVKYLADTAGLAPTEAQPFRYALERRPEASDLFEDKLVGETCARCHSYARIGLQRRSEAEWLRLSHFHVGQFPAVELASNLRSVYWWEIASQEIPKRLGRLYPFDGEAWKQWRQHPKSNPAGSWRVVGHRPGWGDYEGLARIVEKSPDEYSLTLEISYANGKSQKGSGEAIVYTGYEWRGSLTQGDEQVRQVFTISEDGNHLRGRWHLKEVDALGGDWRGTRITDKAELLAVFPPYLKSGAKQTLSLHGFGLAGEVSVDGGIAVTRVISRSPERLVVEVQTTTLTANGSHTVRVGEATASGLLNVYPQVDSVRIEPQPGLARVGGSGGKVPAVPVQFEAIAFSNGEDGKAGTQDDLRIGVFPARWTLGNLNANAEAMKDAEFAGQIDAAGGLFVPAAAGPNPLRKFGTNNAGELQIAASVEDGSRVIKGTAPLIVTVQRWIDPPIR
jgi:quinohemoprotein amine dehydrogenase